MSSTPSDKKPVNKLAIGFCIGGILLAAVIAFVLIFPFDKKDSKKENQNVTTNTEASYDDATQEASTENEEAVDITGIYAQVVNEAIEKYGVLSFGGSAYECFAKGVIKIDLMDFNGDGIDELVLLYTPKEDDISTIAEVWTIKDGKAVLLFSEKSQNEFLESIITFSIYENAERLYIPVYDLSNQSPVYVHLYGFDENGEFKEIYKYEYEAFYDNQLPDGREFEAYNTTETYLNAQHTGVDEFESRKKAMEDTLKADMQNMLKLFGITVTENDNKEEWLGVYQYDDGNYGELYIIKDVNDSNISGIYVYATEVGTYEKRDFVWNRDDSFTGSELFQNGIDFIYYYLENGKITVDYPDGWWPDREYEWVSDIEHMYENVSHPLLTEGIETTTAGFYGVWVYASKDYNDAKQYADSLIKDGFKAGVYETTDWSNLNTEHWYVVSVGESATEDAANAVLSQVKNAGYTDAYVKYTGDIKN